MLTHRHYDHVDGVSELIVHYPNAIVYAPAGCDVESAHICAEGDNITLLNDSLILRTLATPGHTKEHVSYIGGGMAFCGDIVFACGCGRVFEGTLAQMCDSVGRLAALPDETLLYCGHEYTAANIRFACAVEPDNTDLRRRQVMVEKKRGAGIPTVPFTVADEKACNPFFRLRETNVIHAAQKYAGKTLTGDAAVFSALRRWKDSY